MEQQDFNQQQIEEFKQYFANKKQVLLESHHNKDLTMTPAVYLRHTKGIHQYVPAKIPFDAPTVLNEFISPEHWMQLL